MTVKHSRKMAQGSVFYPLRRRSPAALMRVDSVGRSAMAQPRALTRSLTVTCAASRATAAPWKGGVLCRPSVPGSVRQPWRERPPSGARCLTPGAPRGVAHATAALSQSLDLRLAYASMFHRAIAPVLRRPFAAAIGLESTRRSVVHVRSRRRSSCL